MEAKELMIGDWIASSQGKYFRVDFLSNSIQVGDLKFEGENIRPIPLTTEILEKNGFKYKTTDWEVVYEGMHYGEYNERRLFVLIGRDVIKLASHYGYVGRGDPDAHVFAYVLYVHELQHALRLCGLTELADNFKV